MNELAKKYEQMLNKSLPPPLFGQFSISPGPHFHEEGGSDMNTRIAALVFNPRNRKAEAFAGLVTERELLEDKNSLIRECDDVLNDAINGEKP